MGGFLIGAGMAASFVGLGMMAISCIIKYFTSYGFEYESWYFFWGALWVFWGVIGIGFGASVQNNTR